MTDYEQAILDAQGSLDGIQSNLDNIRDAKKKGIRLRTDLEAQWEVGENATWTCDGNEWLIVQGSCHKVYSGIVNSIALIGKGNYYGGYCKKFILIDEIKVAGVQYRTYIRGSKFEQILGGKWDVVHGNKYHKDGNEGKVDVGATLYSEKIENRGRLYKLAFTKLFGKFERKVDKEKEIYDKLEANITKLMEKVKKLKADDGAVTEKIKKLKQRFKKKCVHKSSAGYKLHAKSVDVTCKWGNFVGRGGRSDIHDTGAVRGSDGYVAINKSGQIVMKSGGVYIFK